MPDPIRAELARAVEANEVAERALQSTFPEDMQALCDVNCREIVAEADRLRSDADHLERCYRKVRGPAIRRRYDDIVARMRHRATAIERLATTPDLTAFRKRLRSRSGRKGQQAALERRCEDAEARVLELERQLSEGGRHEGAQFAELPPGQKLTVWSCSDEHRAVFVSSDSDEEYDYRETCPACSAPLSKADYVLVGPVEVIDAAA